MNAPTVTFDLARLFESRSPGRRLSKSRAGPGWLRLLASLIAVGFAFPGLYLVWRNITAESDPLGLLASASVLGPLVRTVELAAFVSICAAALGTALAWLTMRTDLPFRRLWHVILPVPLVFPTFIGAAAFIRTMNPGGLANDVLESIGLGRTPEFRGFWGAALVLILFTYPYVYLPAATRLLTLPGSYEESARLLGDSAWQAVRRVALPQILPAVGAGTLLVFLYTISDFGAVQLMRYDTLTRAIATNQLANQRVALALSLILLVLAAAVVAVERWLSARSPVLGRARSDRVVRYRLGRWRWPAALFVGLSVFFAVGVPSIALIDWSAGGFVRASRGGAPLTVDAGKVVEATWNTVSVSVVAALAAVLAVLPIAFLVGRWRSRSGTIAHAVVISTFALPGLLIALSMRFWILRSDVAFNLLGDSMVLLIFAYVVRFGSLAMGVTLVAARAVPVRLHDAARMLGANGRRRLRTLDIPIMTPALLAGTGLVLLSVMKELPISLLVSPLGFTTLATRIFGSFEDAFVAEAGIMALVLVVISFVLSWFLVLRRMDEL